MNRLTLTLFCVAFSSLCFSCQSPIFDHTNAPAVGAKDPLSLSAASADCALSFSKSELCASLSWDSPPVEGQDSPFTLRFWNSKTSSKNGPYVDPSLTVFTKLWMPAMGHGSSPITTVHTKDPAGGDVTGIYHSTDVFFIMGGDWEVHVQLKQGQTVVEEAILPISI